MKIEFESVKPHIGAIVHVDRSALKDEAFAQRCLEALDKHTVLVFPRIGLNDDEQLAFTDRLGARVEFSSSGEGSKNVSQAVLQVTLDKKISDRTEYVQGTYFWHMDGMPVSDIPPPKATLLSARRIAPKGGQTEFASTFAAYEKLSAAEKAEIADLRVLHSIHASLRPLIDTEEEDHRWRRASVGRERPLVWAPKSGRKSLLIGSTADRIIGMPVPEGRAMITRLIEWAAQPDFKYSHHWQEGDLVVWHNCGALHRVIPYDSESGRLMHRTSLAGTDALN
ncbi:MAG: TauD/TfdA family dioxygenase [Rhodospirillaceae bacterium]|nr:MAG: TauD/TfdA family dioxygenase [Rhodospirillaceae bacterium]